MAKKITGIIKLQIPAGAASPAPPVGPALGQAGLNIMDFCKAFNARTEKDRGLIIPGGHHGLRRSQLHLHHQDAARGRSVEEGGCNLEKGSGEPNRNKVGKVTQAQVEEIANLKEPDLNAASLEAAVSIVSGTARSMGIEIEG